MRLYPKFIKVMMATAAVLTLQSCDNDDEYDYSIMMPNALVTVKTDADETFFLQLDDNTTLLPVNVSESPFGEKEVRALVNYKEVEEPSASFSKAVHINWIDSILTKPMVEGLPTEDENNEIYGNDPVEIVRDWVTVAEDGYLTLRFRTAWGGNPDVKHFVNLVQTNPEDPYEVEFRHNAYGDIYGHQADALVAFRLDKLPDTNGETKKFKLKWKSYSGDKSYEFDYCTRKETEAQPGLTSSRAYNFVK